MSCRVGDRPGPGDRGGVPRRRADHGLERLGRTGRGRRPAGIHAPGCGTLCRVAVPRWPSSLGLALTNATATVPEEPPGAMIHSALKRVEAGRDLSMDADGRVHRGHHGGPLPRGRDRPAAGGPAPQGRDRRRGGRGRRRHAPAHDPHPHPARRRDRRGGHRRRRLGHVQHQHGRRPGHRRRRRAGGQARQPPLHQPQRLGRRAGRAGREHRGRRGPRSRPASTSWASASASPRCCTRR